MEAAETAISPAKAVIMNRLEVPLDALPSRLATECLSVWYGRTQALRDVAIGIPDRQITALIGPSGCGKTTFLRCLNRMNDEIPGSRVEGRVTFDGHDVYARGVSVVALRTRIGMVFQRANPFPASVFDNVAYGPRIHGRARRSELDGVVERSLRQAALWDEVKDRLRMPAVELSGGQQQRLCIARVLAVEPDILLMDEPCSALDPASTFRIEELLRELRSAYTVVIVTHNLQQAARISDATGFFLKGELIEFSTTQRVFEHPKDPRTEDYVCGRFG